MSWEAVLPIVTLILGYLGSLYTESRRERRQRERAILDRIAETKGDALLELQCALPALIQAWGDHLPAVGRQVADSSAHHALPGEEFTVAAARARGMALASRITEDRLRRRIEEFIGLADGEMGWSEGDTEFGTDMAWGELMLIDDEIGGRLRSPP